MEKSQYMTETDLISGKWLKVDSIDIIQILDPPRINLNPGFSMEILSDFPDWKDLTNFWTVKQLGICN